MYSRKECVHCQQMLELDSDRLSSCWPSLSGVLLRAHPGQTHQAYEGLHRLHHLLYLWCYVDLWSSTPFLSENVGELEATQAPGPSHVSDAISTSSTESVDLRFVKLALQSQRRPS